MTSAMRCCAAAGCARAKPMNSAAMMAKPETSLRSMVLIRLRESWNRASRESVAVSGRKTHAPPNDLFIRRSQVEHEPILRNEHAGLPQLGKPRQHGRAHVGDHDAAGVK